VTFTSGEAYRKCREEFLPRCSANNLRRVKEERKDWRGRGVSWPSYPVQISPAAASKPVLFR